MTRSEDGSERQRADAHETQRARRAEAHQPSDHKHGDERSEERIAIFDTTLRDGSQLEGISLTVEDKLRIAEQLDWLGITWIEGGWPGANPKDVEFFRRAATELKLSTSTLVAFGSTRRPLGKVDDDPTLRNLVAAGTRAVCIVGKTWDYHVTEALGTTLEEGVAMVGDSVKFLVGNGLEVMFDAEHFFDGYRRNPEYTLAVLEAAATNGASTLVLCDTNGGSLPFDVEQIVSDVKTHFRNDVILSMHTHDDTGCAVANALAGVRGGARQVQGTINGIGERTGNCNLTTVIANLQLKMGYAVLEPERLARLTQVSNHLAELENLTLNPQAAYVGTSAFAHKAGLHVSAIAKAPDAYEHIDPTTVGNGTRFVVSEMAGRATIKIKAEQLGISVDGKQIGDVIDELKRLEHAGYHFEAADASFELLLRRASGWEQDFFTVESMRVITDEFPPGTGGPTPGSGGVFATEATVKVFVGNERFIRTAEGNGPVNAIDSALRGALAGAYPQLARIHLTDYKVRILDTGSGTGAVVRVLIDSTNGDRSWTTIGVSENIIEASWEAMRDALVYGLMHTGSASPASASASPASAR
jgi:2-isopropylmalate synthase